MEPGIKTEVIGEKKKTLSVSAAIWGDQICRDRRRKSLGVSPALDEV